MQYKPNLEWIFVNIQVFLLYLMIMWSVKIMKNIQQSDQ